MRSQARLAAGVPTESLVARARISTSADGGDVFGVEELGVALVLHAAPMQLRLLLTIVLEVFLMTYVLMPRITRWFARWIYPS